MRYFYYAGLSPTRAEAVEEIQTVSDEFRTLLFSESGIAWYRKQVENSRQKVARLLHVNLCCAPFKLWTGRLIASSYCPS